MFVGGRVVGVLLGGKRFVGDSVENTVEEVARAWVVVVKECELGCDAVGDALGKGLKVKVGWK